MKWAARESIDRLLVIKLSKTDPALGYPVSVLVQITDGLLLRPRGNSLLCRHRHERGLDYGLVHDGRIVDDVLIVNLIMVINRVLGVSSINV